MNKHLLYSCVLILTMMIPSWAQKGKVFSLAVKNIRPFSNEMKNTFLPPFKSSFVNPQQIIIKQTTFTELNNWAQHLMTPQTRPDVAKLFYSLGNNLKSLHITPANNFTPEQLQRINEARHYFLNLTPQQANNILTISSVKFRENAMVLRSPAATEYGYFFMGHGMLSEYESNHCFYESGYIPTIRGNADQGISTWSMKDLIPSTVKTDRPIFVSLDMHGGINFLGKFHAGPNSFLRLSTEDIVRSMQELRASTGTPEANLFVSSCMSGAFLDEFERLPLAAREGINVFVPTGAGQCTFISQISLYHSHVPGRDISKELIEKMIFQIIDGEILAQANVAGQSLNPLQLALEKANTLSDTRLANSLARLFNMQKTKQTHAGPHLRLQDEKTRYFIARTAYDEATARYGEVLNPNDWFNDALQQLKENYAKYYRLDPFLLNWDAEFGFEPLK